MTYQKDEKEIIRTKLGVELLGNTTLQSGTLQDIKDNLYKHILTVTGTPYALKKGEYDKEEKKIKKERDDLETIKIPDTEKRIATFPLTGSDPKIKEGDIKFLDGYKRDLESKKTSLKTIENEVTALNSDLETIVNGYVDDKLKSILDLEEKYVSIFTAKEIAGVTNADEESRWIDLKVADILDKPYIKGPLENIYAETLANDNLQKAYINLIKPSIETHPNTTIRLLATKTRAEIREYLLNRNDGERKEINDILNSVNVQDTKKDALEKIKNKANEQIGDIKKLRDDYKKAKDELKEYATPTANLNRSWLNVIKMHGKNLVNGKDIKEVLKKSTDYKNIANAYLNHEVSKFYLNTDYINVELGVLDTQFALVSMDEKKKALKKINELKDDIGVIKDGVLETLNEELKDAYKNVIMGSSLDAKNNNTGEFEWFMFGKDDKIVENHNPETYAQGGIGMFQEMFLAEPDLETEFYELQKKVVDKHKRASSWLYGGFFNRKKNNRIGVDEVLKLGLGYAVYLNDSEDIVDDLNYLWRDIRYLHRFVASNSIKEILDVYREASKLGEKINDTAREWTEREHNGYNLVDNQVNSLSGWSFKIVDSLWDFVGSQIEAFKKPDSTIVYKVDETAIKPKYHPHLQMLLGGIGAGAILTMTADEVIKHLGSDETLSDKIKHTLGPLVGPLGEITKEAGVAGIVHKAMEPKAK